MLRTKTGANSAPVQMRNEAGRLAVKHRAVGLRFSLCDEARKRHAAFMEVALALWRDPDFRPELSRHCGHARGLAAGSQMTRFGQELEHLQPGSTGRPGRGNCSWRMGAGAGSSFLLGTGQSCCPAQTQSQARARGAEPQELSDSLCLCGGPGRCPLLAPWGRMSSSV